MGFDVIELPIEQLGDWSPEHAAEVLAEHGLSASIAVAMAPGRELCGADAQTVATTQAFLRECLDVAATVGAGAIAGPIYTSTGRTWRITPDERVRLYAELRENLAPVADHAGEVGVKIGIEPLVRYETSLINTVEQALEAIDPLPDSVGLLLDTYHANVEEKDFAESFRLGGPRLVHVHASANDRGAPGADHIDWTGFRDAIARHRLRRSGRDRILHRRERDDRHGGLGLAPARRLRRTPSPSMACRSCASFSRKPHRDQPIARISARAFGRSSRRSALTLV